MSEAENMNGIDTVKDRTKQKNLTRFLLIANGLILGILIVWLVVGNLLVAYLEQPMLKAQADFVQRYPKREANASVNKLIELNNKLGFIRWDYGQLRTPNDLMSPLSQDLKSYLASNSTIINEIITLLRLEPPRFEHFDLSKDFSDLANYDERKHMYWRQLEKLLSIEAIQQYQSGHMQKVIDTLAAARNLILALQEHPSIVPQYVALSIHSDQLAFLRKTSLPIEAHQLITSVITPDSLKSFFLPAQELETLFSARSIQELPQRNGTRYGLSSLKQLLIPFQLPYFKLMGINYWGKSMNMLTKISNQDFCLLDFKTFEETTKTVDPFLDFWGSNYSGLRMLSFLYQKLLGSEFTEKILLAKTTAAKTGNFSSVSKNTEYSRICKAVQYDYQVTDNGQKMTIQMLNLPKWGSYGEGDLPTSFSFTLNPNQLPI
jgi:hypothetical protein